MFEIVPFKAAHVLPLMDQKINADWRGMFTTPGFLELVEKNISVTGLWNGVPMVCGGITYMWPGRGHLWTVFNEESKSCFLPVFRGIRRWIKESVQKDFSRIEVSIPCDFRVGCRRAEMLGFRLECGYAENYLPDGRDAAIYVMTRKGG